MAAKYLKNKKADEQLPPIKSLMLYLHDLVYVLAVVMTFVFAGIVNFVMYFRLEKISMTESLKSIE